ncbi:MAG: DUF5689 domain-containing protein [Bacteroidales bacterium]|jgi:hypothetical protein|nr:DUF5689 domain-containing protein [Bacteroidales bacterium]
MKKQYMMKKNWYFIAVIVCFCFANCQKTWEEPEFNAPVSPYADTTATFKTIAQMKALHVLGTPPDSVPIKKNRNGEYYAYTIKGVVVSSDEGGNCYKYIVVQDETGGLEIPIDQTGLYNDYPVGQTIYVNCLGLVVGDYHNYYQMGWIYEGAVGRINAFAKNQYISKHGLPNPNAVKPVEIKTAADLNDEHVGKLVTIKDGEFAEESKGKPLSYNDYITEHSFIFNGATVVVRTSNYAKFRTTPCPVGKGDITGILTKYNSIYQLVIRTVKDLDFEVKPPTEALYSYIFDANSLVSGGWTVSDPASSTRWSFVNGSMAHLPMTNTACNDWLISPLFTFTPREKVMLYLYSQFDIGAGMQDWFKIYYSTTAQEGTFNEADWVPFSPNFSDFTASFAWTKGFDCSSIPQGSFRIALQYSTPSGKSAGRWYVKELKFEK